MDVLEREAIHNAEWWATYHEAHQPVGEDTQHGGRRSRTRPDDRREIVKDKKTKAPAHDERERIVELAFERGLLFWAPVKIPSALPALIVTQEQADIAMDVLEECIGIVEKER